MPLSTQVFKWVPANLLLEGNPAMDYHPIHSGVEILLVASCYGNRDKLRPDEPLGSYADLTSLYGLQHLRFASRWLNCVSGRDNPDWKI